MNERRTTEASIPARTAPMSRVANRVRRDQQIRRTVRRLATLGNLADPRWRPALVSLARTTVLLDRMYEALRDRPLLDDKGELRSSIDVLRRMISTQQSLLGSLGLLPTSVLPDNAAAKTLDAVFERMEKVRQQREEQEPTPTAD